tara:strand:+ start:386 stop:553 length:168 start_codon:yes stop_codon:yes gene_type:complete
MLVVVVTELGQMVLVQVARVEAETVELLLQVVQVKPEQQTEAVELEEDNLVDQEL